ncbi:MAG: non-heme iron oxygenase ferredoxin subunit [Actinomycetota bacterium]|nr:non-heme iron oxygenase ferredoxin subunit [Actinomycetota bacterium]
MSFLKIAKKNEILEGEMKLLEAGGKEILIVNYNGNYYAINGKCTHMGGDLSEGKLEGRIITCPIHGAKFDVVTGKSISGPKIGMLKLKTKNVPVYEVRVEGNDIIVNV